MFNTFTKIETWEWLEKKLGPLTWASYDQAEYVRVLSLANFTLYTGAFIKPNPMGFGYGDIRNHFALLEALMHGGLVREMQKAKYLVEVYEYLISQPGMGEFTSYQLLLNLSYSHIMNFSGMDFVVLGPGAESGIVKMFAKGSFDDITDKEERRVLKDEIVRWLCASQTEHFKRLGLKFKGLGPDHLPLELADFEHAICEADKYARLAHPQLRGLQDRTQMKRRYTPSERPFPSEVVPRAWSHPDRKRVRVHPDAPQIEKRYVVSHISEQRRQGRKTEYLVHWEGYTDTTWIPAHQIKQDAPSFVGDFLRRARAAKAKRT